MKQAIKTTRRGFLAGSGALTFAVLAGGGLAAFRGEVQAAQQGVTNVNAWVTIDSDSSVTISYGATEMGQGVMTSLPMILAEELDADWSLVKTRQIDQGPPDVYGNPSNGGILFTVGSASIGGYCTIMRRAGAGARRILIHSAAAAWNVEVKEVSSAPGKVLHSASGREMTFGEVAGLPDLVTDVPEITDEDLKPRADWRIIGTDLARRDIPAKTRGATVYSIDVRVPDMVYAAQLLAPVEGETPLVNSDATARAFPGVIEVLTLEHSVVVIAEKWETALTARELLDVEWSTESRFRQADSGQEMLASIAASEDLSGEATEWETRGDAPAALRAAGDKVITATYTTEYLYHAQMEPLAAIAAVDEDGKGAEVWLGTQSQTLSVAAAAQALETTPDRIRFHAMQMGGGFGRRTFFARDILRDALLASRAVGRPVKLMWTREDDVKNGWFRPATAHHMSAALDASGNVTAWRQRVASPSILEFAIPQRWASAKGHDHLVMEGTESRDYTIPDFRAEHVLTERQARISAWRGIGWGPNCFARECFIEELVSAAGRDPVSFRRRLLKDSPRGLAVLDAVIEMSDFGNAPKGRAHGLSFAGYKETRGAGVAEVSVDPESGAIRVHRFWAAVDPGIAVHPENLVAQTEGGITFGLSGLMRERISVTAGEVNQSNFYDYEALRIDSIPDIEVRIVESGAEPSGAGEIGVPMTGAAVANAVHALTGQRLRQMPFAEDAV